VPYIPEKGNIVGFGFVSNWMHGIDILTVSTRLTLVYTKITLNNILASENVVTIMSQACDLFPLYFEHCPRVVGK
jgi:hypothetical protein